MRIEENVHCDEDKYSIKLQQRVQQIFEYSSYIVEVKRTLNEIKNKSLDLYNLFLSEEEKNAKLEAMNYFDKRMKTMINSTLNNLNKYQLVEWKELIYDEDIDDETID